MLHLLKIICNCSTCTQYNCHSTLPQTLKSKCYYFFNRHVRSSVLLCTLFTFWNNFNKLEVIVLLHIVLLHIVFCLCLSSAIQSSKQFLWKKTKTKLYLLRDAVTDPPLVSDLKTSGWGSQTNIKIKRTVQIFTGDCLSQNQYYKEKPLRYIIVH